MTQPKRLTLQRPVRRHGYGLHTGAPAVLELRPGNPGHGVNLVHPVSQRVIPVTVNSIVSTNAGIALGTADWTVQACEHLLSTLWALGLDDVDIIVDGPEVPVFDGSALGFVTMIREAGTRQLPPRPLTLTISEAVRVSGDGGEISVMPHDVLAITCTIDYPDTVIMQQGISVSITPQVFAEEIAPARTWGRLRDGVSMADFLRSNPAVVDTVLVLDNSGLLSGTLRFPNEFVRHRVLDILGALALTGKPLNGHVIANRSTTRLNVDAATAIARTGVERKKQPGFGDAAANLVRETRLVDISPQVLRLLEQDIGAILKLTPDAFEALVCERFERMGFAVRRVGSVYRPDGGIDIVAWPRRSPFPYLLGIQVKHHRSAGVTTGVSTVRDLLGALAGRPFNAGVLVTSTTFTADARWYADQHQHIVRLRDISDLSRWIAGDFLLTEEWRELPSSIRLGEDIDISITDLTGGVG